MTTPSISIPSLSGTVSLFDTSANPTLPSVVTTPVLETGSTAPTASPVTSATSNSRTQSSSNRGTIQATTATQAGGTGNLTQPVFTTTLDPYQVPPTGVVFSGIVQVAKPRGDWVSPGAVAGIAIGTLLLGAATAALAMLVIQKKNKRRSTSSRSRAANAGSHGPVQPATQLDEKAIVAGSRMDGKGVLASTATDPEFLLPQPKDDQSMGAVANQFFVHIGNHVENFYHNNSLREGITPQSDEEELLINQSTRHFAIKRYICREMLSAIAWDCNPRYSLLPSSAVAMAQQMSRGSLNDNTYEVAWSRWRVSTSLLLKHAEPNDKQQAYEYWTHRLGSHLEPFQVSSPEVAQNVLEDLHAICKLAEHLASVICVQPARWEFLWPRDEKRNHLVFFPAFLRTSDSKGRKLDSSKYILEAQKMQ